MDKGTFSSIWIFCLGIVIIFAGFSFAIIVPFFMPFIQNLFYQSFNHNNSIITLAIHDLSHINWIYGILGAVMIGWGTMITIFSWHLFKENVLWIWNTIILSVFLWFIIDTGISLYYNVFLNVYINILLLLLAVIPFIVRKTMKVKNI